MLLECQRISSVCSFAFNTVFTLIDTLVNTNPGQVTCDNPTSDACMSSACTPVPSTTSSGDDFVTFPSTPACAACASPAGTGIVQTPPMSFIPSDYKVIDQSIFWMNEECPLHSYTFSKAWLFAV